MPFPKFPPPPPLTHRPHWAAVLTAGAAIITGPALWGAHGVARHVLVIVGLVVVLGAALGYIRDWHMPFVRNRAESPGFVDRRRKQRAEAMAIVIVEQQLGIMTERTNNETMKNNFWHSSHGMGMRSRDLSPAFFVWSEPRAFTDRSMLVGLVGSCVLRRGEEEFQSGDIECDLDRGFSRMFPGDFATFPSADEIAGKYEVEWIISGGNLASRDSFELNSEGAPI